MVEFWQDLVVDDMSCHVREPDREPHVMGLVAVGGGAGTISRKALVRCFDMFALHRSGASRVSMARPDMPLKHDRAPFEEGALLAASDDAGVRLATDRPPGEGEGACRRGVPDSRSTGAAPPERTVPGRTVPAGIVDGAPVGPFSSRSQGRRVSPALPGVQPDIADCGRSEWWEQPAANLVRGVPRPF